MYDSHRRRLWIEFLERVKGSEEIDMDLESDVLSTLLDKLRAVPLDQWFVDDDGHISVSCVSIALGRGRSVYVHIDDHGINKPRHILQPKDVGPWRKLHGDVFAYLEKKAESEDPAVKAAVAAIAMIDELVR